MNSKELSWKSGDEVGGSLSPKPTGPKNLLQSFFFVVIVSPTSWGSSQAEICDSKYFSNRKNSPSCRATKFLVRNKSNK